MNQAEVDADIDQNFPSNTFGAITAANLRRVLHEVNAAAFTQTAAIDTTLPYTWPSLQTFNGGAIVPTQSPGDNTTKAASTAFVHAALSGVTFDTSQAYTWASLQTFSGGIAVTTINVSGVATLGGGATVPTRSPGDNTTNAASTAFVTAALASVTFDVTQPHTWSGVQTYSVAPIVPTQSPGDNTTKAASTAFVQNEFSSRVLFSRSALAAVSRPSVQTMITVVDLLRGGAFPWVWDGSDCTTDVANDPGQGTIVALGSTPDGSLGGWRKQYRGAVDWTWWGMVPDGVVTGSPDAPTIVSGTNNGAAFINWNIWAKAQGSVNVEPSPGIYLYDGSTTAGSNTACYAFVGIKDMILDGKRRVTLQNTYREDVHGANSAASANFPLFAKQVVVGYVLTAITVPGSNTFSISSSDAANLSVGQVVCLTSCDRQFLGYPPNPQFFEYVTIASISGGTITIVETIKYAHRPDFPDYTLSSPFNAGAARVYTFGAADAWDGKFIIKGIQSNRTVGQNFSQGYATFNKRDIITEDWTGVGFSETLGRSFVHNNPIWYTSGEIDKMIDTLIYNNPRGPAGLGSQSCTPNRMIINGGNIGSIVGFAKQLLVRGTRIGQVQPGGQFGLSGSAVFEGCDIDSAVSTQLGNVTDGAVLNTIDGTNVYWATAGTIVGSISGSILTLTSVSTGSANDILGCVITGTGVAFNTIVQSLASGTIGAAGSTYNLNTSTGTSTGATITIGNTGVLKINLTVLGFSANVWGLVPGMGLNLQASTPNGPMFSNDLGSGFVTSWTWDAASGIGTANTTLPFSSTPSWCTGKIYLIKNGNITFNSCTGADAVRNASDAFAAGQRYFEYKRIPFGGITGQSMFVVAPSGVQLISAEVYVANASSVGTARLTMGFTTINTPAMTADSGGTVLTINLGIAGRRFIDQNQWTGIQTSDALTVGGVAATLLPSGRILGPTISLQFFTQNPSEGQSASGEIILKYSAGMVKKQLTRQFDDSGTISAQHTLIPVQGLVP